MFTEKEYLGHPVFEQLETYSTFYDNLSSSIFPIISVGTGSVINIDTYVYISMQGTLDSIKEILSHERINDAYTLLRKYYDAAIINIYTNLYLDDYFNIDNFVVEKIDNWLKGREQLPNIRVMNNYIQKSEKVVPIYRLLHKDKRYSELRDRCNDHTHYNFYHNVLLNNRQMFIDKKVAMLNRFAKDLENIFILHLVYLFYLSDHYMMASDYLDCLDCGIAPEPGSQYLVAPFVQEIFDTVIKKNRMDLALEIKSKSEMRLG
ncbi:MAG: hypothetical protein JW786_00035 [Desulfobacterales bacterium]|nr:hypothetical protein [Desulfobacterales bacterium]